MKNAFAKQAFTRAIATLLVVPSLYFVLSAFLNYGLGFPGLWDVIAPIFEQPANKHLGLNVNLLIVFGPIAACLIALFQVMRLDIKKENHHLQVHVSFNLKNYYWIITGAALLCTAGMFLYFLGENCNCH
jgi:hypothetical protein